MSSDQPPVQSLRKKFWIYTLLTVAFLAIMKYMVSPLDSAAIVSFEMAKTTDTANSILAGWSGSGLLESFKTSVYLDFIFIALYSAAFFYGCRFAGQASGNSILRNAGIWFSWLVLLAACCDVIENAGMLWTVHRSPVDWVVHLSYDMAKIKFSILIIASLFIVVSFLFWGIGRLEKKFGKAF